MNGDGVLHNTSASWLRSVSPAECLTSVELLVEEPTLVAASTSINSDEGRVGGETKEKNLLDTSLDGKDGTEVIRNRQSVKCTMNPQEVGCQLINMVKNSITSYPLRTRQYCALDGIKLMIDIPESILPVAVPLLEKSTQGRDLPRVLVQPKEEDNSLFRELFRSVEGTLINQISSIKSCIWYSPIWICAMDMLSRRSSSHGQIHRDTTTTKCGYLTVLIFLETSETGGVKFWTGSQNFMPGNEFGVNARPKNLAQLLNRKFRVNVETPVRGKALVFDSRLVHQSLAHQADKQRTVLSFTIACNGLRKIEYTTCPVMVDKRVAIKC